jgi:hypothetical protein
MRTFCGILLCVCGVAVAACRIEGHSSEAEVTLVHFDWVRTVDGWERPTQWTITRVERPAVHPAVVAAGQVFVSLFALVAAAETVDRRSLRRTPA